MNYSKIDLAGPTVIERSVPLPAWLDGIGASEDQIRDCGWAGHEGIGYWPGTITDPALDPATETLNGEIVWAEPDPQTRTVTGTRAKRDLTADELAALNPVPPAVTPLQMRKALRAAGLRPLVDAYTESLSDEAREAWEYCVEVRRDDPFISDAADALGMTAEQRDDLFRLAATQ